MRVLIIPAIIVYTLAQAMLWALSHHNEKAKSALRDDPHKLRVLERIGGAHFASAPASAATSASQSQPRGLGLAAAAEQQLLNAAAARRRDEVQRREEAAIREGVGAGSGAGELVLDEGKFQPQEMQTLAIVQQIGRNVDAIRRLLRC
jgi:hypothetical protein